MIQKVQAFIFRERDSELELLIFEHEITKIHQLIRGTVDDGEEPTSTLFREIREESGLQDFTLISKLGQTVLEVRGGPYRKGPLEKQLHHAYLVRANSVSLDRWSHAVSGSKAEEGLTFYFYWAPVNNQLHKILFDDFKPFIDSLIKTLNRDKH